MFILLQMAFRSRNVFGPFEKSAQGQVIVLTRSQYRTFFFFSFLFNTVFTISLLITDLFLFVLLVHTIKIAERNLYFVFMLRV